MQKFTRPLTREIELDGNRLALTLSEQGIAVRTVGSRRPPWEMAWDQVLCHLTGAGDVAAAVEVLKKGGAAAPAAQPAPAAEKVSTPAPAAEHGSHAAAGAPADDVGSALARLGAWLAKHRTRYLDGLQPGAGKDELDNLGADLGRPLPDGLRGLLGWHNGQKPDFVGHFQDDWDLMGTRDIATAKRELDGGDRAESGWDPAWVPFLDNDAGDYIVLDTSQPGAPVREFWLGKKDNPVVAPSLAAWLGEFVAAVERGEYHEESERGSFLRKK